MLQQRKHERETKEYFPEFVKRKGKKTSDKTTLFTERLEKVLPVVGREIKNQITAIVMTALETEGIYKLCDSIVIETLVDGILVDRDLREGSRLLAENIIKTA